MSPDSARCGLRAVPLPAIIAGRGLRRPPCVCGRWLPRSAPWNLVSNANARIPGPETPACRIARPHLGKRAILRRCRPASVAWRPACIPEAGDVQFSGTRRQLRARQRRTRLGAKTMTLLGVARALRRDPQCRRGRPRGSRHHPRRARTGGHRRTRRLRVTEGNRVPAPQPRECRRLLASIDRLEHGGGIERDLQE